jgi:nucleoside-diphosphate-sugar epimerase
MPAPTSTRPSHSASRRDETLTVAVTGAGGTVGPALLDRLGDSRWIGRIVLLGRHQTPPMADQAKAEFRRVDVRDGQAVERAVAGAGLGIGERDLFATNVEGTRNVARAAAAAGARRFVYTSSAAVYGGRATQTELLREDAPWHASARLFYARHKAQAEVVVREVLHGTGTELYLFRPCAIVGPHAAGALAHRVAPGVTGGVRQLARLGARAGLRPALPPPPVPLQFVHEDDVAQAVALAVEGRGVPGAYNLAGEGALSGAETLRGLGLHALPVPGPLLGGALRAIRLVPPVLPGLAWPELLNGSLLIDSGRARERLGWKPRWSSAEALEATRAAVGW